MSVEDDKWALAQGNQDDGCYTPFGVGSFRFKDSCDIVHRVAWSRQSRGWSPLCGVVQVRMECRGAERQHTTPPEDPGAVTCLQCLGEGA